MFYLKKDMGQMCVSHTRPLGEENVFKTKRVPEA